jgi:hypothetical protein
MPNNTYQDSFPTDPTAVVNYYFKNESEKQEWLTWLQTATEEQKQEMVDTLHSMWLEQTAEAQKQPETSNTPLTNTDQKPAQGEISTPSVNVNTTNSEPTTQTTTSDDFDFDSDLSNYFTESNPVKTENTDNILNDNYKNQEAEFLNELNSSSVENPLIDNKELEPSIETDNSTSELINFGNSKFDNNPLLDTVQISNIELAAKSEDDHYKSETENLNSAGEVSNLYRLFVDAQNQSVAIQNEAQKNQAVLFERIMKMVKEASIINDRVHKINDQNIIQTRKIQELTNSIQATGSVSIQRQVDNLKDDIKGLERNLRYSFEVLERNFNEFRNSAEKRVNYLSEQISSALADTYTVGGTIEKFAKLNAKLESIENKLNNSNSDGFNNNRSNLNSQPKQSETKNPSSLQPKKPSIDKTRFNSHRNSNPKKVEDSVENDYSKPNNKSKNN